MVISTKIYVEHPDLALAPTIQSIQDIDVGVVSEAGTDPQHDTHFFWVETSDFAAVESSLAADHTVDSFRAIAGYEGRRTYGIEYSDAAKLISPPIVEAGGLVLDSHSHADGWTLTLQLDSHETLDRVAAFAEAEDIRFDVFELHQIEGDRTDAEFGLTERQIEALVNAYTQGYYDDPRETSLEELATLLDISQTAVSGRLRRASARLIEEVLVDSDDECG